METSCYCKCHPPRMIHSVLERPLFAILIKVVKAYRLVRFHILSLKSWFLVRPPTAVTCRRNPINGIDATSLWTAPVARMNNIAKLNHSDPFHTLLPLSSVLLLSADRNWGREIPPPYVIDCSVLLTLPTEAEYHYLAHKRFQLSCIHWLIPIGNFGEQ